ncbi:MAG: 4Fe-4S binding protein [Spirochaetes bacterium]|nr:4Fe-4S binding protein [Spirochaetota bacterium]
MKKRPSWWLNFLRAVWPLTYLSAKMTGWPVVGPLFYRMVRPLFTGKNFNVTHIPVNRELRGSGSTYLPNRILDELIRRSSHRVTINRCTCRESEGCTRYPVENACLHLGEGTSHLDPHIATPRSVEEALEHAHRMVGLGLIPMLGRVRMDDLFYGTPNTGRSLTICFCCPCCCTIFKSARFFPGEVRESLVRLRGLRVVVDPSLCTGCGTCAGACFTRAITIADGIASHDDSLCKGCGLCATVCPEGAVSIMVDDVDEAVTDLTGRLRGRINIE